MHAAVFLLSGVVCILASAAFGHAYVHWTGFLPAAWFIGASLGAGGLGAMLLVTGIFGVTVAEDDGLN